MNIKATFATTFWAIFVAMVFVNPDCAIVAGFLSFCVLVGLLVARTEELTEKDKSILSWIGTAASSVILLGVVYWGLIQ